MAGEKAAAKGLMVYTGSEAANQLFVRDNERGDEIADVIDLANSKAPEEHTHTSSQITDRGFGAGRVPVYNAGGRIIGNSPAASNEYATKAYVDASGGKADGPTAAAYARNATGSSWFVVYMNSALQFMRNTSSRRYKKNIRDWAGSVLDLRTVLFDRRGSDTPNDEVGFIAEEVEAVLPEAAMYFDGRIDGINDRVILAAAVADIKRLHARLTEMENRQ